MKKEKSKAQFCPYCYTKISNFSELKKNKKYCCGKCGNYFLVIKCTPIHSYFYY